MRLLAAGSMYILFGLAKADRGLKRSFLPPCLIYRRDDKLGFRVL